MTDPDPRPLEAHPSFWLRFVSDHVSQALAARLAERGLSLAEWEVMRQLFDAPLAPGRLAERIGMTRGAITKVVDRLAAKALVERRAGTADRRTQLVSLTPEGRALLPGLAAAAEALDAEFFGELAAWERASLEHVLKAIARRRRLRPMPPD